MPVIPIEQVQKALERHPSGLTIDGSLSLADRFAHRGKLRKGWVIICAMIERPAKGAEQKCNTDAQSKMQDEIDRQASWSGRPSVEGRQIVGEVTREAKKSSVKAHIGNV